MTGPFLKWVGGKRKLLAEIGPRVPRKIRRYHEAFIGGGALFFHLRDLYPDMPAVLSDTNERLIRTWRGVQRDPEAVIREFGRYRYDRDVFYTARALDIDGGSDAEVAAWFIFINRAGFNGLYRVNRRGGCNVPFGRYTNPTICDADGLRAASRALAGVELVIADFGRVTDRAVRGDFVYFDPPYVPLSATSSFTGYTAGGFGWSEQVRLHDTAAALASRGVHVLLSNSSAALVAELYADAQVSPVSARRAVSANADRRGRVAEVLITFPVGRRSRPAEMTAAKAA